MELNEPCLFEQLDKALKGENPVEAIRAIAIEMNRQGVRKALIINTFLTFHHRLQQANRDQDADRLGDVIDMGTGWYVGRDLFLDE